MVPGFGIADHHDRQRPTVRHSPRRPGVAPEHARIVNQGGGSLVLVDLGRADLGRRRSGGSRRDDALRLAGSSWWGGVIPNAHPRDRLMLLEVGKAPPASGTAHLPAAKPGAEPRRRPTTRTSPLPRDVQLSPVVNRSCVDVGHVRGSPAHTGEPSRTRSRSTRYVRSGPVSLPMSLVLSSPRARCVGREPGPRRRHQRRPAVRGAPRPVVGGAPSPVPADSGPSKPKHKTVIGHFSSAAAARARKSPSVARPTTTSRSRTRRSRATTPCCTAPVVSSSSRTRGAPTGTYVRGRAHPAGPAVPVQNERRSHRPDAARAAVVARVAVVVEDSAHGRGGRCTRLEGGNLVSQVPDRDKPERAEDLLTT